MARQPHIVSFESARARTPGYSSALSLARPVSDRRRNRDDEEEGRAPAPSRSSERQRARAKARASKMFDRQFATRESASAGTEDGAPRAALYEGKMGSMHRRSARMQLSSSAGAVSARIDPTSWLSGLSFISVRALKIATAILCVVLVFTSLYIPAKQYYQAQREHDRLAAEYSVIEQRNEVLDVQNDILASDAGMEDTVRQKFGYVKSGEETAVVTGLSDHATDTSRDSENIEANVLSSSVKSPTQWYTPLLDAFFGVE